MARAYHVPTTYVNRDDDVVDRGSTFAERIVYLVGSFIISALALRFILTLLGANRDSAIADFIYRISQPFVAPFFGLFNYTPQIGLVRFEFETLVAIAFYGIAMALLGRLVGLGRRSY